MLAVERPSGSELGGLRIELELQQRHHREEDHDRDGADGPADLQARVAVGLRGDLVALGAEAVARVPERALDHDEDDGRDVEDDLVKAVDRVCVWRSTRLRGDEGEGTRGEEEQHRDREPRRRDH